MILWGIFFTFLTTISLIFCGNGCCWSWHLLVGWLFIWPENKRILFTFTPPHFLPSTMCVCGVRARATFCVHCYFISILPLCYCDYPNGYTELHCIASHDCVYELTPVSVTASNGCANGKYKQKRDSVYLSVSLTTKIEMDNAQKCKRQMIRRRFDGTSSSSTTSFSYVLHSRAGFFISKWLACMRWRHRRTCINGKDKSFLCHIDGRVAKHFDREKVYVLLLSLLLPFLLLLLRLLLLLLLFHFFVSLFLKCYL